MRDVEPEAGDAAVEPEAHNVVESVADGAMPPVEVDLLLQEAVQAHLPGLRRQQPCGLLAERRAPVVRRRAVPTRIGPDVPVAMLRVARAQRVLEPRVPIARVVRDEVQDDADAALARACDELVEVGQGSEHRLNVPVVGDVVSPVLVRRDRDRRQPQHVDPQPLQILELLDDAGQVADAVGVRIRERADVHLVDDGLLPPGPAHAQR